MFLLIASAVLSVQAGTPDYFVGKWNAQMKVTHGTDSKLVITLYRKGGRLTGTVYSKADGAKEIKNVEEKGNSLTVSFKHGWFTVDLLMNKKDNNHCLAKMADRYDGISTRQISDSK